MKASILITEIPANPRVARPALQGRRRKHRQGKPRAVHMRHIPKRLADLRHGAKIMMRLHQLPETAFLFRTDNLNNHFGQNHRSASEHPRAV